MNSETRTNDSNDADNASEDGRNDIKMTQMIANQSSTVDEGAPAASSVQCPLIPRTLVNTETRMNDNNDADNAAEDEHIANESSTDDEAAPAVQIVHTTGEDNNRNANVDIEAGDASARPPSR